RRRRSGQVDRGRSGLSLRAAAMHDRVSEVLDDTQATPRRGRLGRVERLDDELKATVIERPPGRSVDPNEALAEAAAAKVEGPVMAVRVVPRAPEEHVARPRAACAARVCVVAGPAVAPEGVDAPVAYEAQLGRVVPELVDSPLAHVARGVAIRRQR